MEEKTEERTDKWLAKRMYDIWEDHFADIPRKNFVLIKFGRSASRQLGSIKWANKKTRIKSFIKKKSVETSLKAQDVKKVTVITITRKFQDLSIPDYVVDATIAHELVHYAHGFSSPLKQSYRHPHQGGLIRNELEGRGIGKLHQKAKIWIRENWKNYN